MCATITNDAAVVFTVRDAAAVLGVTPEMVAWLANRMGIEPLRTHGDSRALFVADQVEEMREELKR